jgi:ubiquitin C
MCYYLRQIIMQVKIEFDGVFNMQVDDLATVGDLKNQIRQTLGLMRPRLVYNGGLLQDQNTLYSYQIPNNSCIIVQEMYSIVCWVSDTINGVTLTAPYNLVVHRHNTFADLKYLLHKAYGIDMTDRKFNLNAEITSFDPPDLCPLHRVKVDAGCPVYVF